MAQASPAPDGAVNRMVQAQGGRLHVTDHPGQAPPLVLLHGFPDDSRIHDRLVPLLAPAAPSPWTGSATAARTASSRAP